NRFAVGRDDGGIMRPVACGQRPNRAVSHREFVDLAIERLLLEIRMAVSGQDQVFAVGRPGGQAGAAGSRAAMLELAGGDLSRRAAVGWNDEQMRIARFQVALAVKAIKDRKSTRLNSSHQIISY